MTVDDNEINSADHSGDKAELFAKLRGSGQFDSKVLDAMEAIPREKFFVDIYKQCAYVDHAFPIECGQTISQPYTIAFMTNALKVLSNDKVLEIGTGSGYQSAILSQMGAHVYSIERIPDLSQRAKFVLTDLNYDVNCFVGDGSMGLPEYAPFDKIIVTAAAPNVPMNLIKQLTIGGILVIPIGDRKSQAMHIITKINENDYKEVVKDRFQFVPLIGEDAWDR